MLKNRKLIGFIYSFTPQCIRNLSKSQFFCLFEVGFGERRRFSARLTDTRFVTAVIAHSTKQRLLILTRFSTPNPFVTSALLKLSESGGWSTSYVNCAKLHSWHKPHSFTQAQWESLAFYGNGEGLANYRGSFSLVLDDETSVSPCFEAAN